MMPAFGDGHAHPILGGLERQGPAITGLRTLPDVIEVVRAFARNHPLDEWILGASYDPTLAPGGLFDAKWLDAVVSDRPVILRASDYHSVWCNTMALDRANIRADTPEPRRGIIVRRSNGEPLGTLFELAAFDRVLSALGPPSAERLRQAAQDAQALYNACGVTWVQDAWVDLNSGLVEAYLEIAQDGCALTRTNLALRADPESWRRQCRPFLECRRAVESAGVGDLLTARTVKFFVDGIIENRTASLLDSYSDEPHGHGLAMWDTEALKEAVAAFDALGFQIHMHAIGDAGVRSALDAIEHTVRVNPTWDRRPVIAHVQLVSPDDLPRFVELGVIANYEPVWAQLDAVQHELTLPRLGYDRGERQYPIRTLLDSGTRVSFGSDWPVSTQDPLEGIRVAVTRQTQAGMPTECAYQAFADLNKGKLVVKQLAEVVWLDRDPASIVSGGRVVPKVISPPDLIRGSGLERSS